MSDNENIELNESDTNSETDKSEILSDDDVNEVEAVDELEEDDDNDDDNDDENEYAYEVEAEDEDEDKNINDDDENEIDTEVNKIMSNKIMSTNNALALGEESDEDDDDEDYEEQLQKFKKNINENYLEKFHPEILYNNHQEIQTLVQIVRDKKTGIIIDDFHKNIPILTKYERTRILGQRTKQLNAGAKPFIKVQPNIIEGKIIAEMELKSKKIPFIIKRPLPNGSFEYWKVEDLQLL